MSTSLQQADFYIHHAATPLQPLNLKFACQIIYQTYLKGHSMGILVANTQMATQLDDLLWTFKDISFIPHLHRSSGVVIQTEDYPIIISEKTELLEDLGLDILLLINSPLPESFSRFNKILQFCQNNSSERTFARENYQALQNAGWHIQSHKIADLTAEPRV